MLGCMVLRLCSHTVCPKTLYQYNKKSYNRKCYSPSSRTAYSVTAYRKFRSRWSLHMRLSNVRPLSGTDSTLMRHTHKLRVSVFRTAKDSLLCAKRRRIEPQYATFCNLNRKRPNINKLRFTQEKRGKRVAPMAQTGRAIACRRGRCECSQAAARLAHGPRPKPSSSRRTDTGSQSACPCVCTRRRR